MRPAITFFNIQLSNSRIGDSAAENGTGIFASDVEKVSSSGTIKGNKISKNICLHSAGRFPFGRPEISDGRVLGFLSVKNLWIQSKI